MIGRAVRQADRQPEERGIHFAASHGWQTHRDSAQLGVGALERVARAGPEPLQQLVHPGRQSSDRRLLQHRRLEFQFLDRSRVAWLARQHRGSAGASLRRGARALRVDIVGVLRAARLVVVVDDVTT